MSDKATAGRRSFGRRLASAVGATLVVSLLAIALAVTGARLLLPRITDYRAEMEQWISGLLGHTVAIGSLEAAWSGWTPELLIQDFRLLAKNNRTLARFSEASITIHPLGSLFAGAFRPGRVTVSDARLTVTRRRDGSIAVQGLDESMDAQRDEDDQSLTHWLLSQSELQVESAHILWNDRKRSRPPFPLTDVNFRVRNDGVHHRVDGSIALAQMRGGKLTFALELQGNLLGNDWNGNAFVEGEKIDLDMWPFMSAALSRRTESGIAAFKFWSTWKRDELQTLEGDFALRRLRYQLKEGRLSLDHGGGRLALRRSERGWVIDADQLSLATPWGSWPATSALFRVTNEAAGEPARLDGEISFLRLQDIMPLLMHKMPQEVIAKDLVKALSPHGDLHQVKFEFSPIGEDMEFVTLEAGFDNLAMQPAEGYPGFSGLKGHFTASPDNGTVRFDGRTVSAGAPTLFRERISAGSVTGTMNWQRSDDAWQLQTDQIEVANDDLALSLAGRARWSKAEPDPFVSLIANIKGAELARLTHYIPHKRLPKKVSGWLDRAWKKGEITHGKVLFHGEIGDYPFTRQEGRLKAEIHLNDSELAFARGWPHLKDFSGVLMVEGSALTVRASRGQILNTTIVQGTGTIADLHAKSPVLVVEGRTEGETDDGLRFLKETPLKKRFGHLVGGLETEGRSTSDIRITLPLRGGKRVAKGSIEVAGNVLRSQRIGVRLDAVNGVLNFNEKEIWGENLGAQFHRQPVTLHLRRVRESPALTRIEMRGQTARALLADSLKGAGLPVGSVSEPQPLPDWIIGEADWRASLELPNDWGTSDSRALLEIESDLQGLALRLPAPFGKGAEDRRTLALETTLSERPEKQVTVRYGEDIAGTFFMTPGESGLRLSRGDIGLGGNAFDDSPPDGLRIHGPVEMLSVREWSALFAKRAKQQAATPPAPDESEWLRLIDETIIEVDVERLEVLGRWFDDTRVKIARLAGNTWAVTLDGETLAGNVYLPQRLEKNSIVAELDRMALVSSGQPTDLDPGAVPAIRFNCKNLSYDSVSLGDARMLLLPDANGLRIEQISARTADFDVRGSGIWTLSEDRHTSQFEFEVNADDLGKLLSAVGYQGGAAKGGETTILLDGVWLGPPSRFSLRNIEGNLHFKALNGRLLDVKPGAPGRIFGLLSVTALPRRLTLDFTDLFKKGLTYDRIEGSFSIEEGNAYTNSLLLENPAASVEIAGRTGLIAEDYDQIVTVTPKISANLLLSPIWLAEKLFKKRVLDKAFKYQYTVSGSWDDPRVERVQVAEFPDAVE